MITLIIILYILCIAGMFGVNGIVKKDTDNIKLDIMLCIIFAWVFPLIIMFAIGKLIMIIDYKCECEKRKIELLHKP